MNYAIILSGGIGSRFWPLSRESLPKQLLGIYSKRTFIEETVHRILPLIKERNIYIATNKILEKKIKECLRCFDIPKNNFFFEPSGKNTLPPVALLAHKIISLDAEAVIVVLPSDHFIKNNKIFLKLLNHAITIAKLGYIVTLGIPPYRPETGYGYIKADSKIFLNQPRCYHIRSFIEKPTIEKAKRFVKDSHFYWNSGIFVFTAKVMLNEIKRYAPFIYSLILRMKDIKNISKLWQRLPSISIDYGVMERTQLGVVLPCNCGWSDLGTWSALEEVFKKDKNGNLFIKGNCIDLDSQNTLVWSEKGLVATLGLDNLVVVNTKDATLVCAKDRAQDIKKLLCILKKKSNLNIYR